MPNPIDRAGTFRANIVEYGLKKVDSGSVAITVRAVLDQMWDEDNKDWVMWADYDQEAYGDVWIVKKDGSLNQNAVTSLCRNAGWDGNIESIQAATWHPNQCQVVVQADTYNGETRFKISFVNDYFRTPGGLGGNMSPEDAKSLQMKFGSQLRAMAGSAKAASKAPNGKPPAPPSRNTPSAPQPVHAMASGDPADVPF